MTDHLIDRPAKYQPCPGCGKPTLTAMVSGIRIRLDPGAIDINAEIAALLTGKSTYDVCFYGAPRCMYLEWRDISRIRAQRARTVVASHQCTPLAERPEIVPETELRVPYPKEESDVPAF